MIFRGSRAFGRLSRLTVPCSENRSSTLLPWSSERVPASYSIAQARHDLYSRCESRLVASIPRRTFATDKPVSRPKAHTGRTTNNPRKKAAPKAVVAKKSVVAKKPATKKKSAKTATKPKTKPKAKPKAKSKKSKAKPKPKRRILTEKQKTKLVVAKERLGIKKLKELALTPPTELPATAWMVVSVEAMTEPKGSEQTKGRHVPIKAASTKYRNLTPDQLEHYNHIANENKAKNHAAYRKWLEMYTPAQIRQANQARAALRRSKSQKLRLLQDDRQVKSFRNAYIFFFTDRHKSGDFHGIKPSEAARLIAAEYKALPADELKKYKDIQAQDMSRYEQENKAVYNRDVKHDKRSSRSAA